MPKAKAISLKVRPIQSADLCFEMDGLIGDQNFRLANRDVADLSLLGARVQAFDFASFYAGLGQPVDGEHLSRLKFDSTGIRAAVSSAMLFALRAENLKAVLDKAILLRENAFFGKYKNQDDVIKKTLESFDPLKPDSKPDRLEKLTSISRSQHDALGQEYVKDDRMGVVKTTASDMSSVTNSTTVTGTTHTDHMDGKSKTQTEQTGTSGPSSISNSFSATGAPTGSSKSKSDGKSTGTSDASGTNSSDTTGSSNAVSKGTTDQQQGTKSTSYDYRHPSAENDDRFQRSQVALIDEKYNQFLFSQNLPFLKQVFGNELSAIDADVKRLQVGYLNTILLSPISGVITGVFADLGDCVRAGQPVVRVENDEEILIVGTLQFRSLLAIGSAVTITTQIFDSPRPLTIPGKVVSIRGHDSEDDEWDVIIRCSNRDANNAPIFPINYNFDFDDTTVVVS